jgi:hypothetical protein
MAPRRSAAAITEASAVTSGTWAEQLLRNGMHCTHLVRIEAVHHPMQVDMFRARRYNPGHRRPREASRASVTVGLLAAAQVLSAGLELAGRRCVLVADVPQKMPNGRILRLVKHFAWCTRDNDLAPCMNMIRSDTSRANAIS